MKLLTFDQFLNENVSHLTSFNTVTQEILKKIKFRNHDLVYWLKQNSNDRILNAGESDKVIIDEIDVLIEQFEIYHQDEYPDQVIVNREEITTELLVMSRTIMALIGKIDTGIFQAYLSDYLEFKPKWKTSTKLETTNQKAGVFESNEISFAGYPLNYWKDYADGSVVYRTFDDPKLQIKIESIIDEYRYEDMDDPEEHVDDEDFNFELLSKNMLNLAHWLILTYGNVDAGSLSAYCMQNFTSKEIIPDVSKKLLDVNRTTGVFEA